MGGMTLKAVIFDFNGVIINDEPIHDRLVRDLLLSENLRPNEDELRECCLGRSDRACLSDIFARRERPLIDRDLERLLHQKAAAYLTTLEQLDPLPIYPGVEDLIYKFRLANLPLAVVSGARRAEIELVLERANLKSYFSVVVAGDDILTSKPDPTGYLLAVEQLRSHCPELQPGDCLAIEDTFAGIEAAKRAGITVVGVAHTYPFHMIQRQANWAIDHLNDLELPRIQHVLAGLGDRVDIEELAL